LAGRDFFRFDILQDEPFFFGFYIFQDPVTGGAGGEAIDLFHIREGNIFFVLATNGIIAKFILVKDPSGQAAFVKLVQEHRLIVHKICNLYGATHHDRQDLFQEIIVQLWKAYPKFRGEAKFSTWLYRIALNTAISDLRRQKKYISPIDPDHLPAGLPEVQYPKEQEEQVQQLYAAIDQLTEIEKALVMLYLEDKPYEEMEEILGINQNNLRVKMNRIKDKLRKLTKEAAYGTGKP
jgi:RNA polymerase sigma-70 factor, ECF subfamily